MAFSSGTITFKRFYVQGEPCPRVDEPLFEQLASKAMGADTIQMKDYTEIGWTTGVHILDTQFDFAKNDIADGLHFAVRMDTNKPPTDLVRSYQKLNEQTMLEASGREFLSKVELREAREQARSRADAEARSGTFRRTKCVPAFWDLKRNEVYLAATGNSLAEPFMMLFNQTFGRAIVPATSGEMAARWAVAAGEGRAFDDCRPAFFVQPPDGFDPDADPAAFAEDRSKDFLGTEWLTWLWYTSQVESSAITTQLGQEVTVLFEKSLQMECAFRMTGKMAITADDPVRLPESCVALAGGKRPVRTGLQVATSGEVFSLGIRGDLMNYGGVVVSPPQEAVNPRAVFEDRLEKLRDLIEAMDSLYVAFVRRRLSSKWPQTLNAIRAWAASARRPAVRDEEPVHMGVAS